MIVSGEPIAAAEALKEWAHRRDHRRLVYYGRLDLCAHDPRGENSDAPPSRRRYQAACSQQRPHDIHERRGCCDQEESRFTTPLPPAETVGRSPDVPFEEALTRESNAFLKLSPS